MKPWPSERKSRNRPAAAGIEAPACLPGPAAVRAEGKFFFQVFAARGTSHHASLISRLMRLSLILQPLTIFTRPKRLAALDRKHWNKKNAQIVVCALEPGLPVSASGAEPGAVIDDFCSRLNSRN